METGQGVRMGIHKNENRWTLNIKHKIRKMICMWISSLQLSKNKSEKGHTSANGLTAKAICFLFWYECVSVCVCE